MGPVSVGFPAGGTGCAPRRHAACLLSRPAQVRHRAAALRRLGQRHDRGALHAREHRQPASADGKPEIRHGPGGLHHHLSCLLHGRQESARNGALPGPARSHADSTPNAMRGKGGTFFLVSPLRVSSRAPAGADGPEGLFDAEVGSELLCGPPAAVLAPNPGFGFSNYASDLWSYGDSNPGPLACHQQAAHPPEYISAGHHPCKCPGVHRNPDTLRYFPAVLTGKSTGVQARCGTSPSRTPRASHPPMKCVAYQRLAAPAAWPWCGLWPAAGQSRSAAAPVLIGPAGGGQLASCQVSGWQAARQRAGRPRRWRCTRPISDTGHFRPQSRQFPIRPRALHGSVSPPKRRSGRGRVSRRSHGWATVTSGRLELGWQ
jgi:hypothetical protein